MDSQPRLIYGFAVAIFTYRAGCSLVSAHFLNMDAIQARSSQSGLPKPMPCTRYTLCDVQGRQVLPLYVMIPSHEVFFTSSETPTERRRSLCSSSSLYFLVYDVHGSSSCHMIRYQSFEVFVGNHDSDPVYITVRYAPIRADHARGDRQYRHRYIKDARCITTTYPL